MITLVHVVTWVGYSQPVCRDVEALRKCEVFKIYNTKHPMYLNLSFGMDIACHLGNGGVKGEWDSLT